MSTATVTLSEASFELMTDLATSEATRRLHGGEEDRERAQRAFHDVLPLLAEASGSEDLQAVVADYVRSL